MAQNNISTYGVSDEVFNLRDLMVNVLATVVSTYEAYNVPLPTRRYWTMGRPAEDCAQVTVSFMQQYLGAPGDQANAPQRCEGPRSAVLNISITRDYPIGENAQPVRPDRIMEAGEWSAVDVTVLSDSLKQFDRWGESRGPGVIATINVSDPEGGLQTVNLNLTLVVP